MTDGLMSYEDKLLIAKINIENWVNHWGVDGVVVSFSGGRDSTVLLHLIRSMYPNVKAVFSDTGMEYPEIRNFVKTFDNVHWVKPKRTFKDVLENEGYPVVSKKVSEQIKRLRQGTTEANKVSHNLIRTGISKDGRSIPSRMLTKKWQYLEHAPFKISDKCCDIFKKQPLKKYFHSENLKPFTGMMKSEGGQRALAYPQCNMYYSKEPLSNPIFLWEKEDIDRYIKENNISICEIYFDRTVNGNFIKGESRTGCMFCMFGVHMEKGENRFQKMKISHPKIYEYCMNKLGMKSVLNYLGVEV